MTSIRDNHSLPQSIQGKETIISFLFKRKAMNLNRTISKYSIQDLSDLEVDVCCASIIGLLTRLHIGRNEHQFYPKSNRKSTNEIFFSFLDIESICTERFSDGVFSPHQNQISTQLTPFISLLLLRISRFSMIIGQNYGR